LIHQQPVRWTRNRIVACDGGGGPLGHPRIFINVDKPQINWCTYCGLPFVSSTMQQKARKIPQCSRRGSAWCTIKRGLILLCRRKNIIVNILRVYRRRVIRWSLRERGLRSMSPNVFLMNRWASGRVFWEHCLFTLQRSANPMYILVQDHGFRC